MLQSVGMLQELVNVSLNNLSDSVERKSEEGNEGPDDLEILEGENLEEPENSENLEIPDNEGNLQNENEISDLETNEDNNMVRNQTQPLAWMA